MQPQIALDRLREDFRTLFALQCGKEFTAPGLSDTRSD